MAASDGGAGGGPISAEASAALGEGIVLVFRRWTALQMAVENQWGGRESRAKADQLGASVLSWFCNSRGPHYFEDLVEMMDASISEWFNADFEDGSIEENRQICSWNIIRRIKTEDGFLPATIGSRNISPASKTDDTYIKILLQCCTAADEVESDIVIAFRFEPEQTRATSDWVWGLINKSETYCFRRLRPLPMSPARIGDEIEPEHEVRGLNWPFQELRDEVDLRVAQELLIMHEECLQSNYSSIERLRNSQVQGSAVSQSRQIAGDDDDDSNSSDDDDDASMMDDEAAAAAPEEMVVDRTRPSNPVVPDADGWTTVPPRRGRGRN